MYDKYIDVILWFLEESGCKILMGEYLEKYSGISIVEDLTSSQYVDFWNY